MAKSNSKLPACAAGKDSKSCCRVESLLSIDDRGQMVLPKELRDRAGIKAGDKMALISWDKDGEVCCLTLIKADALALGVKEFLGPIMKDIV
jgi:antitoxin PrlF